MSKRPFAYIGLSMLVSYAVSFYFGDLGRWLVIAAAAAFIIAALFVKALNGSRGALITISAALLASTVFFVAFDRQVDIECGRYDGEKVTVTAKVTGDVYSKYQSDYVEIESSVVDGDDFKCKMLLTVKKDSGIEYDDSITFTGTLVRCTSDYDLSRRCRYRVIDLDYSKLEVVENPVKGVGWLPIRLRARLERAGKELIGGSAGELCNAVTLGDKHSLSPELYNSFKKTGLSYIVVVSGMHMSVIGAFLMLLLGFMRKGPRLRILRVVIVSAGILLYAALVGFTASAVRSAVMIIIVAVGGALWLESEVLNNLGIAAIVLTITNPYAVGDIGMLLSFVSVFGIAFFGLPFINKFELNFFERNNALLEKQNLCASFSEKLPFRLKRTGCFVIKALKELLVVSLAATAASAPVTLMYFGEWHPFVFIYSLPVAVTLSMLMIFTLIAAVCYALPFGLFTAEIFSALARLIADIDINIVNWLASQSFSAFYIEPKYTAVFFTVVFALFAFALTRKRRTVALTVAAAFSIFILAAGYAVVTTFQGGDTNLNIFNTGNGTTITLSSKNSTAVLSCGGKQSKANEIVRKLRTKTRTIDTLLVPSTEKRENRYADVLMNEFDVGSVMLYYNYMTGYPLYTAASENKNFIPLEYNTDVSIELADGIEDYVVNYDGHTWQYIVSDNVTVLVVPYGGKVSELPEDYRNPDIVLLSREPDYFRNEIDYKKAFWLSEKPVPKGLKNCEHVGDGVTIKMN